MQLQHPARPLFFSYSSITLINSRGDFKQPDRPSMSGRTVKGALNLIYLTLCTQDNAKLELVIRLSFFFHLAFHKRSVIALILY